MSEDARWGHERYDAPTLKRALKLYAITDDRWLQGRTLEDCVSQVIQGGATLVQLRAKDATDEALEVLGLALKPLCAKHGVPLIINDSVEVARRIQADGVHVGQSDMALADARRLLGDNAIIGVSVATLDEALEAEAGGADYLGVGAMFATATKTDADLVSFETLRAITQAVSIPSVAIGGLDARTIPSLRGSGIDGVAVVSALFAAQDPKAAAQELFQVIANTDFKSA